MLGNFLDNMIGVVSPGRQLQRAHARHQLAKITNATGHRSLDKLMSGGGQSGYEAPHRNRLNR